MTAPDPTAGTIDPDAFAPDSHTEESRAHYKIAVRSEASWALRKLASARRDIEANRELFDEEYKRLEVWLENANSSHMRDVEYFEAILCNWHQELLDADPAAKTIRLPGGTLQARQAQGHLRVDDEKFIPWALANAPALVRTKHEPIKVEIKEQTKIAVDGYGAGRTRGSGPGG